MSNWNEETEATLTSLAGEGQVSQDTLASIADTMEITKRSVGSKLRKMGFDVQKAAERTSTFSAENEDEIRSFLATNDGTHTYAQVAESVCGGAFSAKQIQGKVLSMELTASVAKAPAKASVKTYSDAEEATVISMANAGDFLEDIAAALGKELNSVRGKALSLLRAESISALPKQKNTKEAAADPVAAIKDIASKSVEEIASILGKTERGVKTMLTRRGLNAADYKAKVAKVAE